MKRILMVLCMLVVTACSSASHKTVQADGSVVKIPLAELQAMQASFYRIELDGKEIRFFAVKGSDGRIRTALDACDVCYKERKGYQQQGDVMLCRNCNLTFPVDRIGPSSVGGCNPHFLSSQVAGDQLLLPVAELKQGARFFP
ncbi:DUF2318 domain-containing protein [Trichlorobacter lovleyi]|uniref:DUF2318 domain-containing protein n=1 Tax=Trichlorobacter lovleyi TaxID=313985 RepID=UPI0023F2C52F|nr:DUF2318 domain-containing protein [Trichlorobacter lovleyi]